jgi:hypothetical protein
LNIERVTAESAATTTKSFPAIPKVQSILIKKKLKKKISSDLFIIKKLIHLKKIY